MVSYSVMFFTACLHIGFQTNIFVNIDQPIAVPGNLCASFVMYCGFLYFLQDMVLLPQYYKRRMFWPISFLIELTLSITVMEVLLLFVWARIELLISLWVKAAIRYYGSVNEADYGHHETTIVGILVTYIAALFCMSAIMATAESDEEQTEVEEEVKEEVNEEVKEEVNEEVKEEVKQQQKNLKQQQDQSLKEKQNQSHKELQDQSLKEQIDQQEFEQLEERLLAPTNCVILADGEPLSSET
ncbi:X-linked retinitis pigmentosa GTPase regulator-interacting protein 1-like [Drosophila miranda]|uniref:X-linked retinitis pigmentosa GTPase regulator-interacting protein 1-like n=1 Tax=Drosophila miranda TaxID=7229 RepID=UPI0007E5EC0E|nr:X-linked retinitis pigmentosa GTPase regulator-interacting protein 1-like [Drosophila miranda]